MPVSSMVILQTILTANVDHPSSSQPVSSMVILQTILTANVDHLLHPCGYILLHFQCQLKSIIHSLPVKHFLPWLQRFSPKEIIVLRPPHPEILDELNGVAPLLVSVGPEHGCQVGQVDGILVKMCCHENVLQRCFELYPDLFLQSYDAGVLKSHR